MDALDVRFFANPDTPFAHGEQSTFSIKQEGTAALRSVLTNLVEYSVHWVFLLGRQVGSISISRSAAPQHPEHDAENHQQHGPTTREEKRAQATPCWQHAARKSKSQQRCNTQLQVLPPLLC